MGKLCKFLRKLFRPVSALFACPSVRFPSSHQQWRRLFHHHVYLPHSTYTDFPHPPTHTDTHMWTSSHVSTDALTLHMQRERSPHPSPVVIHATRAMQTETTSIHSVHRPHYHHHNNPLRSSVLLLLLRPCPTTTTLVLLFVSRPSLN